MSVEDQIELFPPPPPKRPPGVAPISKGRPGDEKKPIEERAGTKLNHRFTWPVNARGKDGTIKQHGLVDDSQRVYQGGGELGDFVFWKLGLVSLAIGVWNEVKDVVDFIELVDHKANVCYRSPVTVWKSMGQTYNAGIGQRIGIPLHLCERSQP